jgi:hypothetical protein
VPGPEGGAVLPARALDHERQWLRRSLSEQYDAVVGSAARVLSEYPGLRTSGGTIADVLVDLVAVHLYLTGQTRRFDDLVRAGGAGPHIPLARCITSGLRRLPSHRGATLMRTTLPDHEIGWYRDQGSVTEWAFAPALTSGRSRVRGDVDVLVWSMTARRTHLVVPEPSDQVVFLPGTRFKVLTVADTGRTRILLRELSPVEIDANGAAQPGHVPFDEVAINALTEAGEKWLPEDADRDLPELCADRYSSPPGLLLRGPAPTRAGGAKTGVEAGAKTGADASGSHRAAGAEAPAASSHTEGRAL